MGDRNIRNDLKIYDEIILDVDSEKWMEAMKSEIDSMHSNQVWSLVVYLKVLYLLGVNGFTKGRLGWMVR